MRRILILLISTAACLGARGQHPAPEEYIYPIRDVEGLYSANFGEIRPGHFHAGVDIKTDAEEGKPVVAAADGYVSRVVLQAGGYGRAVYLTLHNGTTVVYGHLRRFRDDIERHVRRERYERRSNGVNLWFGPGTWPVKQGDVVAYSGDSGSSGGPHLHYEIRDTETQRLYNPVREGIIRPRDEYPPRIVRLHYVEVDTVQGVPVHSRPESYAVVRTIPFWVIIVCAVLFIIISSNTSLSIFILFCLYALSGFVYEFWCWWRGRPNPIQADLAAQQAALDAEAENESCPTCGSTAQKQ